MAIIKNLVDLMKGQVKIDSMVNVGTKVTVRLPFMICKEWQIASNSDNLEVHDAYKYPGKRILIVEDKYINLEIVKSFLEDSELIIDEAANGKEAVDKIRNAAAGTYDLVFMDISMPVMRGDEAAVLIRQIDRADCKELPIIAMTANALESDVRNLQTSTTRGDLKMSEQMANRQTLIKICELCPRQCHVDRTIGSGYCGESENVSVARASLHKWEEPCISGKLGSGTVFFSGCSLKCVFCHINLVTPTHFAQQIAVALQNAKLQGLAIPVVYNTSGYERVETLRLLEGLVDIYLPDLKYYSSQLSERYSNTPDYFKYASLAIEEMVRQTGNPIFAVNESSKKQMMKRGVIVRHMVLPGHTKDSKEVIKYLYDTYGEHIYISILNQYTPMPNLQDYPELNRRVTKREYNKVVDYAICLGVQNAWIQEGNTARESFIPDFDVFGDYLSQMEKPSTL